MIVIEGVSTGFCFSLSKDRKDLVVEIIKAPLCLIKVLQMARLGQEGALLNKNKIKNKSDLCIPLCTLRHTNATKTQMRKYSAIRQVSDNSVHFLQ